MDDRKVFFKDCEQILNHESSQVNACILNISQVPFDISMKRGFIYLGSYTGNKSSELGILRLLLMWVWK